MSGNDMHRVWMNMRGNHTNIHVTRENGKCRDLVLSESINAGFSNFDVHHELFFNCMFNLSQKFGSNTVFQLFGEIAMYFRSPQFLALTEQSYKPNGWVLFPLERHVLKKCVRNPLIISLDSLASDLLSIKVRIAGGAKMPWERLQCSSTHEIAHAENCVVVEVNKYSMDVVFPDGRTHEEKIADIEKGLKFVMEKYSLNAEDVLLVNMSNECVSAPKSIPVNVKDISTEQQLHLESKNLCRVYNYTICM